MAGIRKAPPGGSSSGSRGASAAPPGSRGCFEPILERAVSIEVIPRLVGAHKRAAPQSTGSWVPPAGAVNELASVSLAADHDAASAFVLRFVRRGISPEDICLGLLGPAARKLGEQWVDDDRNIAEVTLGLYRLHEVLRTLGTVVPPPVLRGRSFPKALLVPVPGEGHVFGAAVLGDFFRRSGWEVSGSPPASVEELRDWVAQESFDAVGLSLATEARLPATLACVNAVRQSSCNRDVLIFVGGRLFDAQPALAHQLPADWVSTDAREAVREAGRRIAQRLGARLE